MANIIVVFESRFGQAQKIAEHVADRAKRGGHDARAVHASLATRAGLEEADGVIVVAPVYFGHHPKAIRRFLTTYAGTLSQSPLAFVTVCNAAADPAPATRTKVEQTALRTLDRTGVHANLIVAAAGAFAYPRYGFLIRRMMRLIAKKAGAPTDVKRVHELTNWAELDRDLAPFFGGLPLSEEDANGLAGSAIFP